MGSRNSKLKGSTFRISVCEKLVGIARSRPPEDCSRHKRRNDDGRGHCIHQPHRRKKCSETSFACTFAGLRKGGRNILGGKLAGGGRLPFCAPGLEQDQCV